MANQTESVVTGPSSLPAPGHGPALEPPNTFDAVFDRVFNDLIDRALFRPVTAATATGSPLPLPPDFDAVFASVFHTAVDEALAEIDGLAVAQREAALARQEAQAEAVEQAELEAAKVRALTQAQEALAAGVAAGVKMNLGDNDDATVSVDEEEEEEDDEDDWDEEDEDDDSEEGYLEHVARLLPSPPASPPLTPLLLPPAATDDSATEEGEEGEEEEDDGEEEEKEADTEEDPEAVVSGPVLDKGKGVATGPEVDAPEDDSMNNALHEPLEERCARYRTDTAVRYYLFLLDQFHRLKAAEGGQQQQQQQQQQQKQQQQWLEAQAHAVLERMVEMQPGIMMDGVQEEVEVHEEVDVEETIEVDETTYGPSLRFHHHYRHRPHEPPSSLPRGQGVRKTRRPPLAGRGHGHGPYARVAEILAADTVLAPATVHAAVGEEEAVERATEIVCVPPPPLSMPHTVSPEV